MQKYKLNWRFWFFSLLLSIISIVFIINLPEVLADIRIDNPKTDGNGENIVLVILMLIIPIYLITSLTMFFQYFRFNGCGLKITNKGIENTYVFTIILAFVIFVPIKLIPWEAVKTYKNENDLPVIEVDPKKIKANFIAKWIISIMNYNFCYPFVKPKISKEIVEEYIKTTPN